MHGFVVNFACVFARRRVPMVGFVKTPIRCKTVLVFFNGLLILTNGAYTITVKVVSDLVANLCRMLTRCRVPMILFVALPNFCKGMLVLLNRRLIFANGTLAASVIDMSIVVTPFVDMLASGRVPVIRFVVLPILSIRVLVRVIVTRR